MATVAMASYVDQIGETAGLVFQTLEREGQLSLARLTKEVDLSRDAVMQAVGWLAREDKIEFEERNRSRLVSLKA